MYRIRTPQHAGQSTLRSASPSPLQRSNSASMEIVASRARKNEASRMRKPLAEKNSNEAIDNEDITPADPSFRSRSGVPIKGAASTDYTKTTMPKNFKQPLTCFYWHHHGFCTKTDDRCIYAHRFTGVVASAPVFLGSGKGTVAGRNALEEVNQYAEREHALREWEARLMGQEMRLQGRQKQVAAPDNLVAAVQCVYKAIAMAKSSAESARSVLKRRREEISNTTPKLLAVGDIDTSKALLDAVDGAMGAVSGIDLDFHFLELDLKEKFGNTPVLMDFLETYLDSSEY